MAVRDDLRALGKADEPPHLLGAPALEDALEREVDRARDVAVARVAVGARDALELEWRSDVEEGDRVAVEEPSQLLERHVLHWLRNSRSTSLNRSG